MSHHQLRYLPIALLIAGCAGGPLKDDDTGQQIQDALTPAAVDAAKPPLPPKTVPGKPDSSLRAAAPEPFAPPEPRFDLVVNNAPALEVFTGIVSNTQYSMLIHPNVQGNISVSLKDVTVREALEAIRNLYGYDYTIKGRRIFIQPNTIQTRIFSVNYLNTLRKGTSDIRVTSGSITSSGGQQAVSTGATSTTAMSGGDAASLQSSTLETTYNSDLWQELKAALDALVGSKDGRSVVPSPQSGLVVVRALPAELSAVEEFLNASRTVVERQVMLEAKIVEVELNDGFQAGINWAVLSDGGTKHDFSSGASADSFALAGQSVAEGATLGNTLGGGIAGAAGTTAGGLFSLAFQTGNFAALIEFLETQGSVQVLSSPRIATLNNQKAVLKVGTDQFFVTNVSTTTTIGTGGGTAATPNVTLQPFFSGIALDVTPQIDEKDNINLHVRPSVSEVKTVETIINLGTGIRGLGELRLPLASSNISETDSVVRASDGQIIAIGGLMQQASVSSRTNVPGIGDIPLFGALFSRTEQALRKKELVILIKPTVVHGPKSWSNDVAASRERIERLFPAPAPTQN